MAISIVGTPTHGGTNFSSAYTVTAFSPGAGSNRLVVIVLTSDDEGTIDTVTWGSATLANGKIVSAIDADATSFARCVIYYVLEANLNSGSNIVVTSAAGSVFDCNIYTLSGVDQVTPVSATMSDIQASTAQTSTLNKSIAIPANGLAIAGISTAFNASNTSRTWSATSGTWTTDLDVANFSNTQFSTANSANATTAHVSWSVAAFYTLAAVAFNQSTGTVPGQGGAVISGQAPSSISGTVLVPLVARERTGRIVMPRRKIFVPPWRRPIGGPLLHV